METRRTDEPDFDPRQHRRWKGLDANEYANPPAGLFVSWGGKMVGARGVAVYFVLAILALVGATLYAGWRTEAAVTHAVTNLQGRLDEVNIAVLRDHRALKIGQDRTTCILTMTQNDREQFRSRFYAGAFKSWCPWVEE